MATRSVYCFFGRMASPIWGPIPSVHTSGTYTVRFDRQRLDISGGADRGLASAELLSARMTKGRDLAIGQLHSKSKHLSKSKDLASRDRAVGEAEELLAVPRGLLDAWLTPAVLFRGRPGTAQRQRRRGARARSRASSRFRRLILQDISHRVAEPCTRWSLTARARRPRAGIERAGSKHPTCDFQTTLDRSRPDELRLLP